jgi:glycosyltransferase involved in cell wall biosynthesis
MIKVLVINTVRFKLNGISAVIMNYYKAMDKQNLQMDFVAIDEPIQEFRGLFQQYGLQCFIVQKSNIFKYFFKLISVAKRGNYDVVHIHGNSANMAFELLACWVAGIKVRITHSHNTSTLHPTMHKLLFPLFTLLCTNRLACGQDAGKWLYHEKGFTEIKNGIDLKRYRFDNRIRREYRRKIGAGDKVVIGHVGNFIEQKNHTFLLDFYAKLISKNKNYLLLLVSDGYLLESMKDKAKSLGIQDNILFLGKTSLVEKYLQAMDIFVLPSLHEGLPVVLVEAQAAGIPCIVADTVTREANLTNSMSFLPIKNPNDWAQEILNTTHKTEDRDREVICENWQIMIADAGYDITKNANLMKEMYQTFVNSIE